MTATQSNNDDGYFNDLSRQPTGSSGSPDEPQQTNSSRPNDDAPKVKRVACVICRKRKLRCDGCRPSCGTCSRLGHSCAYDEVRRKSGPKRGYVKELEARLAQVETQLKNNDNTTQASPERSEPEPTQFLKTVPEMEPFDLPNNLSMDGIMTDFGMDPLNLKGNSMPSVVPGIGLSSDENLSWEMIGLGLEEPLPPQEAIDELTTLYFEQVHEATPILHKQRYFMAMNLAPYMRPSVCLRYAMWALAASVSDRYFDAKELFYRRSRKYIDLDEMKGQGEGMVSVAHAQTWTLLSMFEFKHMYFPRAWMSAGRSVRLAQMMGLNRLDGIGLDVKQVLPPPKDWVEREERRRTFWAAYCTDRFASTGTGWPMTIDERDIMTSLPSSEEAFQNNMEQPSMSLEAAMTPEGAAKLSSFAGVVIMAHFFGTNLNHLHRPSTDEREDDLQGEFWKRHRNLDNILLHKALSLPQHLRLPFAVRDSNAVFVNMAIHSSAICLHQAAIFKAEKNNLPESLVQQSQNRCVLAAAEIATTVRMISHIDTRSMNPYLPFCLYVSARVFVQYLRKVSQDATVQQSLEFLLSVMGLIKRYNPLAESFLIQLGLDIEGSGLDTLLHNPDISSARLKGMYRFSSVNDCGLSGRDEQASKPQESTPGTGTTPSTDTDYLGFRPAAFNNVSLPTRNIADTYPYKYGDSMYPHNRKFSSTGQPVDYKGDWNELYGAVPHESSLSNPPNLSMNGQAQFERHDSNASTGSGISPSTSNTIQEDVGNATNSTNYSTTSFGAFTTSMNPQALPVTANMTWAYGDSILGPPSRTGMTPGPTTGTSPRSTSSATTMGMSSAAGMVPGMTQQTTTDLPSPGHKTFTQMMDALGQSGGLRTPEMWYQGGMQ